ncbi:MAG: hypothetical protein KA255_19895 [Candidatus Obscuribacter sp.]|jgi:hypothetical protein|nr:hypothetical protein [Candidatus Obscuribacter sp.]
MFPQTKSAKELLFAIVFGVTSLVSIMKTPATLMLSIFDVSQKRVIGDIPLEKLILSNKLFTSLYLSRDREYCQLYLTESEKYVALNMDLL